MEELYECYAVVRLAKQDMTRDTGFLFNGTIELFDYDKESAITRAKEMSELNDERIFVFKQVLEVQHDDNPVVGIRLKSGKKVEE